MRLRISMWDSRPRLSSYPGQPGAAVPHHALGQVLGARSLLLAFAILILVVAPSTAADLLAPPPKVALAFNRLYDYPDLVAALQKMVAAHPDLSDAFQPGKERRGPGPVVRHDQQSEDRPRPLQARDVCRWQHSRQRGPGGRGQPVLDLVPVRERRPQRDAPEAAGRAGVLRRADGQPRRPRLLVQRSEHHAQLAEREASPRRRPRRPRRRGWVRRPRRRRPDHRDAPQESDGPVEGLARRSPADGAGQAGRAGRIRDARVRRDRQRRRRPGQRGSPRRL